MLDWQDAHVGFEAAVKNVPPELRGKRPDRMPHSLWELLEHLRLTQLDILEFCRNADYKEPHWPDDYWPKTAGPPSPGAWDESITSFIRDRAAMKGLAMDPAVDLFATIPHGSGQTYFREILVVADHNAHHLGQVVSTRQILGIWPPKS